MKVYFMCAYYSQWAHLNLVPRTQIQWDAYQFAKATKNKSINGYTTFPWKGKPHERIDTSNVLRARQIFGVFLNGHLESLGVKNPSIIPIPSKDGLVGVDTYRSYEMVMDALHGTLFQAHVEPILRFTIKMAKASEGGPRDRDILRQNMKLTHYPASKTVVLVDDIITSGASLLASYDVLSKWAYPPKCAVCCAQTVSDSLISSFGYHDREYDPNPPTF